MLIFILFKLHSSENKIKDLEEAKTQMQSVNVDKEISSLTEKYNELLRIEEELGDRAVFAGLQIMKQLLNNNQQMR